ncbi:G protein-coupled glucose receptor regulating Gpa2-domain-containing protein [Xylariaceae sp. FL1651]|nr:G protein-coupled glucose receptor regulating Gpa2-domain-containing protein [Xylariaceae sp. FL1651]
MAPLQQLLTAAMTEFMSTYDSFLSKRDSTQTMDTRDPQTLVVMCVSLSFAAISVIAALFAFYWFVRMRRGFRQDMIMLLIQSDMAKAIWLIISPLFYFITQRPFSSNWAFCQVSGFFLTVTIEACDIAVLLIAIHTALFIVKRKHLGSVVGLQPYRRVAYVLWAIVPIILAAVVPITGSSFVDNGYHCYLPIQPNWYRSALSWVPRYIIFGFIIVTYSWLYLYVYIRFRRFGKDQRRASTPSSQSRVGSPRQRPKRKFLSNDVPPTPPIADYGLLDPVRGSIATNDAFKLRQDSVTSTVSTLRLGEGLCVPAASHQVRKSSITWNLVDFGRNGSDSPASSSLHNETTPISPTTRPCTPFSHIINNNASCAIRAPQPIHVAVTDGSSHRQRSQWKRHLSVVYLRGNSGHRGSKNSLSNLITALRRGPSPAENNHNAVLEEEFGISSSVHLSTEVSEEVMRRSRDKMQRQMRLLFVYPAIYMLTWIAPFVSHLYGYDDVYVAAYSGNNSVAAFDSSAPYSTFNNGSYTGIYMMTQQQLTSIFQPREPFVLRIISMASLCIGAAVDCAFFSAWERPWRHLRGGFWEGLAMRLRLPRIFGFVVGAGGESTGGPGRTRDERVADERVARNRRDLEREMVIAFRAKTGGAGSGGGAEQGSTGTAIGSEDGRRREWWDVLDEWT